MKMNNDKKISSAFIYLLLGVLFSSPVFSGEADVVKAKITPLGLATVAHADTGWEHYANLWQVLNEKGEVIGERVLHHPHVNEQPFSRSLTLNIPSKVRTITIRAKDSVHGFGGKVVTLNVPL